MESRACFKVSLILFAEDTCAAARTDKCADSVKSIRDTERENSNQHKRKFCRIAEQTSYTALFKDREESCRQSLTSFGEACGFLRRSDSKRDTDQSRRHNGDKDSALYFQSQQYYGQEQTDEENPELRLVQSGKSGNAAVKSDDTDIEDPDIGDKDALCRRQWRAAGSEGST